MKAFVIFPAICVFVLTLSLVTLGGQSRPRTILWSTLVTATFGGLMTWLSVEAFTFLYFSNFIGVLICIPCLTYLTNRLFSLDSNKKTFWIRILGLGVVSTAVTLVLAWYLILFSFIHNPMDPVRNKEQVENHDE